MLQGDLGPDTCGETQEEGPVHPGALEIRGRHGPFLDAPRSPWRGQSPYLCMCLPEEYSRPACKQLQTQEDLLYSVPEADVTNYLKLSGLKQWKVILS